jgi:4-amino-4-deoxy-L-arabinose transferase-like glycosyltransferase
LKFRAWPRFPGRWFWLLNLGLLALYAWTLSERLSIVVESAGGRCTAVVMDRRSTIPCPELEGGILGLYLESGPRFELYDLIERGPLDWVAPRAGWQSLRLILSGDDPETRSYEGQELVALLPGQGAWRRVADELRARADGAASFGGAGVGGATTSSVVLGYEEPLPGAFSVETELRRPDDPAGLVFLGADGRSGWHFIVSGRDRRGTWYRWEEGSPAEAVRGIPLDKSFLSQGQSLLRHVLRAHHGALLLLAMGWLLVKALGRTASWRFHFPRSQLHAFRIPAPAAVLVATLFAFWTTVYIAAHVLERMPHVQDSVTYLFQAQTLARGRLWAPEPPLPEFFEQEFLLAEDGRWVGKYPPGYPLLLAAGVLLSQPWLINPFLAALTVPLLYKLGGALYSRRVGLGAALLAAASPFFLFMSGSMMAHTAELFWITLFMLSWLWALTRAKGRRWAILAGLALGMAFLTRQPAAVAVGVPFIAITMLPALREGRARAAFSRAAILTIAALPLVVLLFAYQYAITGHAFEDLRQRYWSFDRLGFGEEPGMDENAFTIDDVNERAAISWYYDPSQPPHGHSPARGLYNTERNWLSLEINLFGWLPFITLAFCCLAFVARRPNWADVSLLAVAASLIGIYVAYWAAGTSYGPRYYYAALPAFLLLTVRGIQAAGDRIAAGPSDAGFHGAGPNGQIGRLVMGILVVAFVLGNLSITLPAFAKWYQGYNFIDRPSPALAEEGQDEQAILFINVTDKNNWWEYGRYFSSNTPWLDGPIIYARDLGDRENGRLLALYPNFQAYGISGDQITPLGDKIAATGAAR